ncbi:acetyl-CoA carboxylase biotin carboxyl carrier protein [Nonomuraea sediminis]|uniref:acetyl-CoA carboxylase biotin carboxyl carrier protein n=1 Tax=Nonomuraea sediminis TaxID=2835864 RepID=UPI001BDCA607|nr:acetyl-CoA carboxylase biotin carboxyl carrier protein [Nonomuraea sediminis]
MSEPESEIVDGVVKGAERLMRASDRPLRRVVVRSGEASVELEWPSAAQAADEAEPADAVSDPSRAFVRAPMVGTFYRAPEPGADPFVRSGDLVELGSQIGILEAMKIMNPIEADVAGRVSEVLVPDGTQVEYDQPLVAIEPASI